MYKLTLIDKVSFVLVILGALNWLLLGLVNFNLVSTILGGVPVLVRTAYILVGLAGIDMIIFIYKSRKSLN